MPAGILIIAGRAFAVPWALMPSALEVPVFVFPIQGIAQMGYAAWSIMGAVGNAIAGLVHRFARMDFVMGPKIAPLALKIAVRVVFQRAVERWELRRQILQVLVFLWTINAKERSIVNVKIMRSVQEGLARHAATEHVMKGWERIAALVSRIAHARNRKCVITAFA